MLDPTWYVVLNIVVVHKLLVPWMSLADHVWLVCAELSAAGVEPRRRCHSARARYITAVTLPIDAGASVK